MDTHKKQHRVAMVYPNNEVIVEFSVPNTPSEIRKMVTKIKRNAPGEVKFCYEAGVCGFMSNGDRDWLVGHVQKHGQKIRLTPKVASLGRSHVRTAFRAC
jgi:hypothetical protein